MRTVATQVRVLPQAADADPVAVALRTVRKVDGAGGTVEGEAAEVLRGAEREHATVETDHPVAGATGRTRHRHDRRPQLLRAERTVEVGVAEGEDAAVAGNEPVALAARRRRHADDRRFQLQRS